MSMYQGYKTELDEAYKRRHYETTVGSVFEQGAIVYDHRRGFYWTVDSVVSESVEEGVPIYCCSRQGQDGTTRMEFICQDFLRLEQVS